MTERDYAPLSVACVRGLCEKLYDKRKFAGGEIEKMVKDFNDANNTNQIKKLIRVLGQDLMSSTNPNVKNGALMGLSSVAVGLGQDCVSYLSELTHPIIACLGESEARVRYAATEALFNVLKIARSDSLTLFPIVFDALARLAADPEPQVRQGAELLDRLVKDIVVESGRVTLNSLVPLLRARLAARAAGARQFAVGWVCALDAAPSLGLRAHLPELLDPLMAVLDDPNPEIRRMCEVQLNEFLRSIKKEPAEVDFQAMINILIVHAQSTEDLIQLTAITWLKEFVELAGAALLPHASGVLAAALPALAYNDDARRKIRETAAIVNFQLMNLVVSDAAEDTGDVTAAPTRDVTAAPTRDVTAAPTRDVTAAPARDVTNVSGDTGDVTDAAGDKGDVAAGRTALNLDAVVGVLTKMLNHNSVHTKVATLDWILHLYTKLPNMMYGQTERVFGGAVGALTDPADDVVRRALAVLAEICSCPAPAATPPASAATPPTPATTATPPTPATTATPSATFATPPASAAGVLESSPYYHKFLRALLRLLAADENLLEDRGAFIIRQLCVLLGAEEVFGALARTLRDARELRFAARLVDVLSALLLTAAELHHTRRQLRAFADPATHALFEALYASWCHSPVALLALCLLTHNYAHCNRLIATFGDLEITVDFLTEVDKLVQLIESPIFAYLRLELLGGAQSAELRGALFGLLMLLPQSDAFHALRRRLQCAPAAPLPLPVPPSRANNIDFDALLQQFVTLQEAHRRERLLERRISRARLYDPPQ